MKRNRTSLRFSSLLIAASLLSGLSLNTAQAQSSGPLAETLARLDAFVTELESLDVQTETLENPSFEDRILDAMQIELCGNLSHAELGLQLEAQPVKGEAEVGLGLGPNFMGTGLQIEIQPKLEGNIHLASQTQASLGSSVCIDIYDLAHIIENGIEGSGDSSIEEFVGSLNDEAKGQITAFAGHSTGELLDLIVLLLIEAGIDPAASTSSLVDGLMAPVTAMEKFTAQTWSNPENLSETMAMSNEIIQSIPVPPILRDTFEDSLDELSSLSAADLNPCDYDMEFIPGLEDMYEVICGIEPLFTSFAEYVEPLGRLDDKVFETAEGEMKNLSETVNYLASGAKDDVKGLYDTLNSEFGKLDSDVFNKIETKICKTFPAGAKGGYSGLGECWANVSFNPCDVTSLTIDWGCKLF